MPPPSFSKASTHALPSGFSGESVKLAWIGPLVAVTLSSIQLMPTCSRSLASGGTRV